MRSAYAVHRPVANSYLVRERDRRRLRDLLKVLAGALLIAAALLGIIRTQLAVLDTGYRIGQLERELRELAQAERELSLEAAHLSGPDRLRERAREELGMVERSVDRLVFSQEIR